MDKVVKKSSEVKAPRKTGRPQIIFTPDQINKVEALAAVCNQQQIADYFGINIQTFTRLLNRDSKVMLAYKSGKAKAIADVGHSLLTKALNGDTVCQIFYLKTQAGWRETAEIHHKSSGGTHSTYKVTFGGKDGVGDGEGDEPLTIDAYDDEDDDDYVLVDDDYGFPDELLLDYDDEFVDE